MRHIDDDERRARLARRHALHPEHRVADPVAATRAMTVLHSTEPHSVHLAIRARTHGVTLADVDRALYDDRTLVKQLAMRRTLFVFPRDLLPAAWGSASARVAGTEARRLAADVEKAGVCADGAAWVNQAVAQVAARLAAGDDLDVAALRRELPDLEARIVFGSGAWTQEAAAGPRVVTVAGARGLVVRGPNGGHWRLSRPRWTSTRSWLGDVPEALDEAAGYAELVRRWLVTFGPGTEDDVVWWLGGTKSAVRRAFADVEAVPVSLDHGRSGFVLPDDLDPVADPGDWAALLPSLDPTTMGWRHREHYLDAVDAPFLFDRAGNGGPTAWWNGRVVGSWVQDPDGVVQVLARRPLPAAARATLDREAAALTQWLGGEVVNSIYAAPMVRGERLP